MEIHEHSDNIYISISNAPLATLLCEVVHTSVYVWLLLESRTYWRTLCIAPNAFCKAKKQTNKSKVKFFIVINIKA